MSLHDGTRFITVMARMLLHVSGGRERGDRWSLRYTDARGKIRSSAGRPVSPTSTRTVCRLSARRAAAGFVFLFAPRADSTLSTLCRGDSSHSPTTHTIYVRRHQALAFSKLYSIRYSARRGARQSVPYVVPPYDRPGERGPSGPVGSRVVGRAPLGPSDSSMLADRQGHTWYRPRALALFKVNNSRPTQRCN